MAKARRYNKGKLRYELFPSFFKKELAKVYTMGAEKYTIRDEQGNIVEDGSDNWRKGFLWKNALASVMRHLEKFDNGEDFDYDWPQEILDQYGPSLHLANAAWGISVLMESYQIHPELDNRNHKYLNHAKVGLDIDEVLALWVPAWCDHWNMEEPQSWYFDRKIMDKFAQMREEGILDDFYLNLKPAIDPNTIPFEPHCYVTSRPVSTNITEQWLDKYGFPTRPVYTVGVGESKVDVIKSAGIEIFVDDRFDNFVELNKNGICCFLYDAPHNRRYDVGYKRIKTLKDLPL